jgi:hypothetical protein
LDDRTIAERGQHLHEEVKFTDLNSVALFLVYIDSNKERRWVKKLRMYLQRASWSPSTPVVFRNQPFNEW